MKKQDLMKKRFLLISVVLLVALVGFVVPVFAGGWATITVDSLPESIQAGETARIEFTVLQHGKTPVHTLNWDNKVTSLTPILTATLDDTTLEFEAQPAKQIGAWFVDVTLPQAGAWEWSIAPNPLGGVTELEPLVVEPAKTASVAAGSVTVVPMVLGVVLIGLAIVGFVWWRGRETAVTGAMRS